MFKGHDFAESRGKELRNAAKTVAMSVFHDPDDDQIAFKDSQWLSDTDVHPLFCQE